MVTSMFFSMSPGSKLSVPLAATKSAPGWALPPVGGVLERHRAGVAAARASRRNAPPSCRSAARPRRTASTASVGTIVIVLNGDDGGGLCEHAEVAEGREQIHGECFIRLHHGVAADLHPQGGTRGTGRDDQRLVCKLAEIRARTAQGSADRGAVARFPVHGQRLRRGCVERDGEIDVGETGLPFVNLRIGNADGRAGAGVLRIEVEAGGRAHRAHAARNLGRQLSAEVNVERVAGARPALGARLDLVHQDVDAVAVAHVAAAADDIACEHRAAARRACFHHRVGRGRHAVQRGAAVVDVVRRVDAGACRQRQAHQCDGQELHEGEDRAAHGQFPE